LKGKREEKEKKRRIGYWKGRKELKEICE